MIKIDIFRYALFEKISTGLPSNGQPLNCHAGPMTNTATTLSQSALVSFCGLSITRYGTVKPPSLRRCKSTSFSRLQPCVRLSSLLMYFKSCKMSLALYIVMRDVLALGMMMMGVRLGRLFCAACCGVNLAAEVGSRPEFGAADGLVGGFLTVGFVPSVTDFSVIP